MADIDLKHDFFFLHNFHDDDDHNNNDHSNNHHDNHSCQWNSDMQRQRQQLTKHIRYQFILPHYYYDNNNCDYNSNNTSNNNDIHNNTSNDPNNRHCDQYSSMYDPHRTQSLFESLKLCCISRLPNVRHPPPHHYHHHGYHCHDYVDDQTEINSSDDTIDLYAHLIDVLAHQSPSLVGYKHSSLSPPSSSFSSSTTCSASSHQTLPVGIDAMILQCWQFIVDNSSCCYISGSDYDCGVDFDSCDYDHGDSRCSSVLYNNLDSYELLLLAECCLNVIILYTQQQQSVINNNSHYNDINYHSVHHSNHDDNHQQIYRLGHHHCNDNNFFKLQRK